MSTIKEKYETLEKHVDVLNKILDATTKALELSLRMPVQEDFDPFEGDEFNPGLPTTRTAPQKSPRESWYDKMAGQTQESDLVAQPTDDVKLT